MVYWVSPHLHQDARNVKTEIAKIALERINNSRINQGSASNIQISGEKNSNGRRPNKMTEEKD